MTWPDDRPSGYSDDLSFDESNEVWTSDQAIIQKSGGKTKTFLIVITGTSIYFGDAE